MVFRKMFPLGDSFFKNTSFSSKARNLSKVPLYWLSLTAFPWLNVWFLIEERQSVDPLLSTQANFDIFWSDIRLENNDDNARRDTMTRDGNVRAPSM